MEKSVIRFGEKAMKPRTSVLIATNSNYMFYSNKVKKSITKLTFPYPLIINSHRVLLSKDSVAIYFIQDHANNVVYAWRHGTNLVISNDTLKANKEFDRLINHTFNKSYQLTAE